jgi:hypothetical protein
MASSEGHDRYVQLQHGPVLPVEPVELAITLEARGFRLRREPGDVLDVQPYARLTLDDCQRILRWKWHLLAIVDHVDSTRVQ